MANAEIHIDPNNPPISVVRWGLRQAFTPDDLRDFLWDRSELREVVTKLDHDSSLSDILKELVSYCYTRALWEYLLSEMRVCRPHWYSEMARRIGPSGGMLEVPRMQDASPDMNRLLSELGEWKCIHSEAQALLGDFNTLNIQIRECYAGINTATLKRVIMMWDEEYEERLIQAAKRWESSAAWSPALERLCQQIPEKATRIRNQFGQLFTNDSIRSVVLLIVRKKLVEQLCVDLGDLVQKLWTVLNTADLNIRQRVEGLQRIMQERDLC